MEDRKIRKRTEAEVEGGWPTWWYTCGECHGAINYLADICPHCDAVISWEGLGLQKRPKRYTGEQTEPSE